MIVPFKSLSKKHKMIAGFLYRSKNTVFGNADLKYDEILKILNIALMSVAANRVLAGNCYFVALMENSRNASSVSKKRQKIYDFIKSMDKYEKKYARDLLVDSKIEPGVYKNKSILEELLNQKYITKEKFNSLKKRYCYRARKQCTEIKEDIFACDDISAIIKKKNSDYEYIKKMTAPIGTKENGYLAVYKDNVSKISNDVEKLIEQADEAEIKKQVDYFSAIASLNTKLLMSVCFSVLVSESHRRKEFVKKNNDFTTREYIAMRNSSVQKILFNSCLFLGYSDEKEKTAKREQFVFELRKLSKSKNRTKKIPTLMLKILIKKIEEKEDVTRGITSKSQYLYDIAVKKIDMVLWQYRYIRDGKQRKNKKAQDNE